MALAGTSARGQELEPRTYANVPVGVNFIAVVYGFSSGNVFMDPALPIEDLDADVHLLAARYTRTFGLAGHSAKLRVLLPYSSGHWEGDLEGEFRTRSARGTGDARLVFAMNFTGSPALDRDEFAEYQQKTIVGGSLQVVAPTGDYDSTKLINLGSNRWTLKPEIGISHAFSKWILEGAVSAWFFTDNDDFFGGSTLEQDPLYVGKLYAIRQLRPGLWLGFGVGFGEGGTTFVDDVRRQTLQQNWRFGATVTYPLTPNQGLSLALGSGVTRRSGGDFDSIAISYQFSWGGR